jgi:hypothetical protein
VAAYKIDQSNGQFSEVDLAAAPHEDADYRNGCKVPDADEAGLWKS